MTVIPGHMPWPPWIARLLAKGYQEAWSSAYAGRQGRQGSAACLGVALNSVEDRRPVGVEDPLQLQNRVVYGGLEVAVLSVYHQPHVRLHQNSHTSRPVIPGIMSDLK